MTFSNFTKTHKNQIFLALVILVISFGTFRQLNIALALNEKGDHNTHIRAVKELLEGTNPYIWTTESYKNLESDPNNKGYAYFPGIMYVNSAVYIPHLILKAYTAYSPNTNSLMQIPGIVASIFVGIFFIKHFYKKNNAAMLFSVFLWTFNSLFLTRHSLGGYDAVTICLLLWALYYLEKDDVISGALFALSVAFKTFPIILFLVFLFKSTSKLKFLAAGLLIGIFVSLPFLKSISDFQNYLNGSVLVHGNRFIQGRPFLFYISYYYKVELFQIIPFKVYSIGAIASGWLITTILYATKTIRNKYVLSLFPFLTFYLLTPVLNRTYLLWGIPFFLLGTYELFKGKYRALFYIANILYWVFCIWYLLQWKDGFHIWRP